MAFIQNKVTVQLAISREETVHNIRENLRQIPNWFGTLFYPNGYSAYIVSAGPSMEKYVTELRLKERMEHPHRDFVVFCVKHSLPRLVKMGIEPDFCVLLDGRDFNADSTHGVNRKSLFERIPEKTIFMVASMAHPGYAQYLLTNGARVLGWHTAVDGLKDFMDRIREPIITGGTSSGMRCIGIANAMGIRDMTLVGFDSCIHNPTPEVLAEKDKKGRQKYMPVDLPVRHPQADPAQRVMIDTLEEQYKNAGYTYTASLAKRFYTTGELLAQAQDFETLFGSGQFDIQFKVLDDGLASHMFNNMHVPKREYSFVEYLKNLVPKKNLAEVEPVDVQLGNVRTPTNERQEEETKTV
jgi:hypothetical protein